MSDVKQRLKWQMDKRIQRMKARKRKLGPRKIIADFINQMEALRTKSSKLDEFDQGIDAIARDLDRNMKAIDPDVQMEIKWNDE